MITLVQGRLDRFLINPMPTLHYGRKKAAICTIGKFMIVHGGIDQYDSVTNTIQVFNLRLMKWIKLMINNKTDFLQLHQMTLALPSVPDHKLIKDLIATYPRPKIKSNEGLYIFGGRDKKGRATSKMWRIKILQDPWTIEEVSELGNTPPPRYGHAMSYLNNLHALVVYGGENEAGKVFGDLHIFSLHLGQWISIKYPNNKYRPIPRTRFSHAVIEDRRTSKLFVLGGLSTHNFAGGNLDYFEINTNMYSNNLADKIENSAAMEPSENRDDVMFNANTNFNRKKRYIKEKLKQFKSSKNYLPFPVSAIVSKIK